MHQQISLSHLFQRSAECSHQRWRQALHKADSIAQEQLLSACQSHTARHWIEGGKQPTLSQAMCAGKPVQQRRLTGLRTANQCHHKRASMLTPLAMQLAVGAYMLQFF